MHDRRAMTRRVPRSEWREDGVWQLPAGVQLGTDPSISLRYNSQHDSCRCTALNLCTAVDRSGGTAVQMSDYPMPYLCDASSCGVVFIVVECKLSVSCTCCNGILPRSRDRAADAARTLVLDVSVWVRVSCAVAHRDYSSLHACKEEEEERCLFLEREW